MPFDFCEYFIRINPHSITYHYKAFSILGYAKILNLQ